MQIPILFLLVSLLSGGMAMFMKKIPHPRVAAGGIGITLAFWGSSTLYLLVQGSRALLAGEIIRLGAGGWEAPLGIELVLDGIGLGGNILIFLVALPVLLFACGDKSGSSEFFFYSWFFIAACQGVVMGRDLFSIFVFFEIIAISAYILIGLKKAPRAILSGFRYLLAGSVSIFFYLVAVLIIYRSTGSLEIPRFGESGLDGPARALAGAALLCGIGTRMAIFPFHGWLPEAHSMAVHPVSALLSGLLIKIPLFLLFRLAPFFASGSFPGISSILMGLGAITALYGALKALGQEDGKRLLAYSSVSQMGFLMAGFGALLSLFPAGGNGIGIAGDGGAGESAAAAAVMVIFLHMVNHGLFKPLLFLAVGSIAAAAGSRKLSRFRGALRSGAVHPLWGWAAILGALSLMGLPLTGGYVSKQLLSGLFYPHPLFATLLTAASVLSAAYTGKFIAAVPGWGTKGNGAGDTGGGNVPGKRLPGWHEALPVLLAVIGIILGGILLPLIGFAGASGGAAGGAGGGAAGGAVGGIFRILSWLSADAGKIFTPAYLVKQGAIIAGGMVVYGVSTIPGPGRILQRWSGTALGTDGTLAALTGGCLALYLLLL